MMHYKRSIRLGLTHYMGSVQRARQWVYGDEVCESRPRTFKPIGAARMAGCPLLLPACNFGFSFSKDENFLRWLFLERARLQKTNPECKAPTWFVDTPNNGSLHRKPFFEALQMKYVVAESYHDIYENPAWKS
ncbi:hypothetical protein [Paracoccus sp. SY]|uniref:hypothetical protein n=1 Tax=Paracoccus sp. SY TaxID=1330255 RepID=UPI0011AF995D|nr:hypothetical protein [Paracoccus sp. SY]